jgi:hypothetical protein
MGLDGYRRFDGEILLDGERINDLTVDQPHLDRHVLVEFADAPGVVPAVTRTIEQPIARPPRREARGGP